MARKEQWSPLPSERVLVESQPYYRDNIKWLLYLAIPTIGLSLLVALFVWLYYKLMDIRWVLTDRRFIVGSGWLTRRATTLTLEKIQEVNRAQRFLERHLFHTLTMSIETAATAGTTEVRQVAEDDRLPGALETAVHKLQGSDAAPEMSDSRSSLAPPGSAA